MFSGDDAIPAAFEEYVTLEEEIDPAVNYAIFHVKKTGCSGFRFSCQAP